MATAPATYSPGQSSEKHQKQRRIFKDLDWVRGDGRGFQQCRPAYLRTGAANAASGSAYAEFGTTKVIVSVFGPRESKKAMLYSDIGRLNCNVSFTTFSTPVRGQGLDHKEYSSMLYKALEGAIILETFPKTTVDVFALVLESGGKCAGEPIMLIGRFQGVGLYGDQIQLHGCDLGCVIGDLPVIISCASLALADAGIMMYDLVSAVSVSCFGTNLVIDPTSEEEACQDGNFMISLMPARNEVTQLTITGEWTTTKIDEAMELCRDACLKLAEVMTSCLKDAITALSSC